MTNNDWQNIAQKTKDWAIEIPLKTGGNPTRQEGKSGPASL
jgi:hypothetical protein